MQNLIHIRDELILEAHLDADEPHIHVCKLFCCIIP